MPTKSTQTFKKLPGVFSFQRGFNVTDGVMLNEYADGTLSPVQVVRHGIRGTQNVNESEAAVTDKNKERALSNIQVTETAKLAPHAIAMQVQFSLSFIEITKTLSACASADRELMKGIRGSVESFLVECKQAAAEAIALRFARNILNARWLWRNRLYASAVTVTVTKRNEPNEKLAEVDALKVPLNHFDEPTAEERRVADHLVRTMRGESTHGVAIVARVKFDAPGTIEVYPSQNYIENKPEGFARPLYKLNLVQRPDLSAGGSAVVGDAAIRDQKISNALKTFDTWYPEYADVGRPLPIEPLGASLDLMGFYRNKASASAFKILGRLNTVEPTSDDGLFALAVMMRGGVFSESDKKKEKADKSAPETQTEDDE